MPVMSPFDIAIARQASVFSLDYAHCDIAQTFSYGANNWGLFQADATIYVGEFVATLPDSTGASQAGNYTVSISTHHLTTFTEAHVHWEGSGFTVSYSLNGGTSWTSVAEDGVVPLSAGVDFDIRVAFPAGVADNTPQLTSLTVYVFNTNTTKTLDGVLPLTFSGLVFHDDGAALTGTITLNLDQQLSNPPAEPPPAPTPAPYDQPYGTIEFWARVDSGTGTIFTSSLGSITTTTNTGTVYVDGVLNATPSLSDSEFHHFVVTGSFDTSATASIGGVGLTISHVAAYHEELSATVVADNYAGATTGLQLVVDDTDTVSVTESSPATDIYAYAWQIVSGSS